jgi:hypothetical protein
MLKIFERRCPAPVLPVTGIITEEARRAAYPQCYKAGRRGGTDAANTGKRRGKGAEKHFTQEV